MRKRATPKEKKHAVDEFYRRSAKREKTVTEIYQELALEFGVEPRTIQRWIKRSRQLEQESQMQVLEKQIEHIKLMQALATAAIDGLPRSFPDLKSFDSFAEFNDSIVTVFRRLVGNFSWKDLAEHLGDQGKKIEEMSYRLDEFAPMYLKSDSDISQYKEDLFDAYLMIKAGGLKIVSESSNTMEWEGSYQLNQRCGHCPDPHYDPAY